LGQAVQQLKEESGEGIWVGGATLPVMLADLGLIDEYEFLVQPILAGHGPTLLVGLRDRIQLELVDRHEFRSGYSHASSGLTRLVVAPIHAKTELKSLGPPMMAAQDCSACSAPDSGRNSNSPAQTIGIRASWSNTLCLIVLIASP
jgi:hypothetical protein